MYSNGDSSSRRTPMANQMKRLRDRSEKVAKTKEMLSKQAGQTKQILSKHADKIAKRAEEHERFINKGLKMSLMHTVCSLSYLFLYGGFIIDTRNGIIISCVDFISYKMYFLVSLCTFAIQDFCYYANTLFLVMLLCFPRNEKFFMICFSFAEGPLAWALIVWRCSLAFNSFDKIVSVFRHLLSAKAAKIICGILDTMAKMPATSDVQIAHARKLCNRRMMRSELSFVSALRQSLQLY